MQLSSDTVDKSDHNFGVLTVWVQVQSKGALGHWNALLRLGVVDTTQ